MKFIIPLDKLSRKDAEKTLRELMLNYKKDINFDFSIFTRKERKQKYKNLFND
jgi:hypothetical protein